MIIFTRLTALAEVITYSELRVQIKYGKLYLEPRRAAKISLYAKIRPILEAHIHTMISDCQLVNLFLTLRSMYSTIPCGHT